MPYFEARCEYTPSHRISFMSSTDSSLHIAGTRVLAKNTLASFHSFFFPWQINLVKGMSFWQFLHCGWGWGLSYTS